MSADFKSHVLLRDEKGLFGIPFKRLLLAGVGSGMTYTLFNIALPAWSIPIAVLTGLLTIILTGLRGGIPLWGRLIYRVRGTLLLISARYPRSVLGQLTAILELPTELVRLDSFRVFAPPTQNIDVDLREWVTFVHAQEDDGLMFVDAPLKETPTDEQR
jgi:xanthosine utilization system XapX-like protein